MCLESTPERWATNHERSPRERPQEEHGSFLEDSPGHDEGPRELPDKAGSRSVQKAPELGHSAKGGSEYVGTGEPARKNLGDFTARVLREREEGTIIRQAPDGERRVNF